MDYVHRLYREGESIEIPQCHLLSLEAVRSVSPAFAEHVEQGGRYVIWSFAAVIAWAKGGMLGVCEGPFRGQGAFKNCCWNPVEVGKDRSVFVIALPDGWQHRPEDLQALANDFLGLYQNGDAEELRTFARRLELSEALRVLEALPQEMFSQAS
jgi:hypothetical protein